MIMRKSKWIQSGTHTTLIHHRLLQYLYEKLVRLELLPGNIINAVAGSGSSSLGRSNICLSILLMLSRYLF